MEKTKLLSIAVIGLLFLNLGLLAFLWFNNGQGRPQQGLGKQAQTRALDFLMDELKFDASQRAACSELLQTQRRDMDSLQNINRQNRNNLYDNLKTGDSTAAVAIGDVQRQVELAAFVYFRNIRALCREDQKAHFDRIIYDAMRMMAPLKPPDPYK
jgi:hypothetical protein